MSAWAAILAAALCPGVAACRSAFVETTVENQSSAPLHLIEVDYPSASFGMQTLDSHASYRYHFKVQGTGPVTVTFIDSTGKPHTATGPTLTQGQHGNLKITIDQANAVSWGANLTSGTP